MHFANKPLQTNLKTKAKFDRRRSVEWRKQRINFFGASFFSMPFAARSARHRTRVRVFAVSDDALPSDRQSWIPFVLISFFYGEFFFTLCSFKANARYAAFVTIVALRLNSKSAINRSFRFANADHCAAAAYGAVGGRVCAIAKLPKTACLGTRAWS